MRDARNTSRVLEIVNDRLPFEKLKGFVSRKISSYSHLWMKALLWCILNYDMLLESDVGVVEARVHGWHRRVQRL